NIALVLQAKDDTVFDAALAQTGIEVVKIGRAIEGTHVQFKNNADLFTFDVAEIRDTWYKTSFLLDQKQSKNGMAEERYNNYKNQPLRYAFPSHFTGEKPVIDSSKPRPKAAIIREK